MDIKQLKYFLAITEENSITKAAKKLSYFTTTLEPSTENFRRRDWK